mmetsp:Transcript_9392/g.24299  ORF Transcript_9392/g.24299 Transcript_9392/m.24299 type:complete len:300 (+) Transcript_9392:96-995(+)
MSDIHAYGASFGCLSRRRFILSLACLILVFCVMQIFRWVMKWHFVWDSLLGLPVPPQHTAGCTGTQCYEVFTCFGMKDTTYHLREPLVSLAGAVFAPVGIIGAMHGYHPHLTTFALFVAASAALHVGVIVADYAYYSTCNAYPGNMLFQTVLTPPIGALVPMSAATVSQLWATPSFTVPTVDAIVGGFNVLAWYFAFAGAYALFLVYAAREANCLAFFAERGPLGLGVHYGLAQWDEVINHDAVRRHKGRDMRSQFIDDAKLPSADQSDAEALSAGSVPAGYGATATKRTTMYAGMLAA